MGEAPGIAAELDLLEQLSAANAPFRPTTRQKVKEIVRRAGLRRRRASLRRSPAFQPFPDGLTRADYGSGRRSSRMCDSFASSGRRCQPPVGSLSIHCERRTVAVFTQHRLCGGTDLETRPPILIRGRALGTSWSRPTLLCFRSKARTLSTRPRSMA
jgi:hypothetical protein